MHPNSTLLTPLHIMHNFFSDAVNAALDQRDQDHCEESLSEELLSDKESVDISHKTLLSDTCTDSSDDSEYGMPGPSRIEHAVGNVSSSESDESHDSHKALSKSTNLLDIFVNNGYKIIIHLFYSFSVSFSNV